MTRPPITRRPDPRPSLRRLAGAALLLAAACGPSGDSAANATAADSAGAASSAAAPATPTPSDSGMAGMDHGNMPGTAMNRPAPRDSNQAFLRMFSDHHQGLIVMADSAEERAQSPTAKADARELHQKQEREQGRMLAMLRREYSDSITPMVIPSNRAMLDTTLRAPAAAFDSAFYRQVIHHHAEGVRMIDGMLPHLSGEARQMAEQGRRGQRQEIQEFERKAAARGT